MLALGAEPVESGRLTVDTHLHVTMSHAAVPVFHGESGTFLTTSTRTSIVNQVDGAQLVEGKGQLAIASIWPPFSLRAGRTALDGVLNQMVVLREFCQRHPEFVIVKTPGEARQQVRRGRIALIPGVEGGEGIESVEDVDRLYAAGVRSVTLVHFGDSQIGGSARGQNAFNFFDTIVDGKNQTGLSELGRDVVMRMFQLGMIVDISHASDVTSGQVLDLAEEHDTPIINSHAGSRELLGIERNIPDVIAARIAKGGGMVGVTASDHMLSRVPDSEKWDGYVPGTCDDLIAHWKHLMRVVPAEQLNLGSDLNGFIKRPKPGGACPDGLRNTGDLPALYDALIAHGVPKAAIDGMGWRFLKLWDTLEKKADAHVKEHALEADVNAASAFNVAM
jgi:membrane dipeptidase